MRWKSFVGGVVTTLAVLGLMALVAAASYRYGATVARMGLAPGPRASNWQHPLRVVPIDRGESISSAVVPEIEEATP